MKRTHWNIGLYGGLSLLILAPLVAPRYLEVGQYHIALWFALLCVYSVFLRRLKCPDCGWPVLHLKKKIWRTTIAAPWIPPRCRECGREF